MRLFWIFEPQICAGLVCSQLVYDCYAQISISTGFFWICWQTLTKPREKRFNADFFMGQLELRLSKLGTTWRTKNRTHKSFRALKLSKFQITNVPTQLWSPLSIIRISIFLQKRKNFHLRQWKKTFSTLWLTVELWLTFKTKFQIFLVMKKIFYWNKCRRIFEG